MDCLHHKPLSLCQCVFLSPSASVPLRFLAQIADGLSLRRALPAFSRQIHCVLTCSFKYHPDALFWLSQFWGGADDFDLLPVDSYRILLTMSAVRSQQTFGPVSLSALGQERTSRNSNRV